MVHELISQLGEKTILLAILFNFSLHFYFSVFIVSHFSFLCVNYRGFLSCTVLFL